MRRRVAVAGVGFGGIVLLSLVLWVALGPGAAWLLEHADNVTDLQGAERAEALDRVRGRAIAVGTGLLAVVAIYFTADNARSARRASVVAEQGLVTSRYLTAVEQLGSARIDVRLGGLYALERVARDSSRDQPIIVAVLSAYLREHLADTDARVRPSPAAGADQQVDRLRADLWAALDVLGRRRHHDDLRPPSLGRLDLSRLDLNEIHMSNLRMRRVNLSGSDLTFSTLTDADLSSADLSGADFSYTNLSRTSLAFANLSGAKLRGAILHETNLIGADLRGADLRDADITRADMRDAITDHGS